MRSTGSPAQRTVANSEQTASPAPMIDPTSLDASQNVFVNGDSAKPRFDHSARILLRDATATATTARGRLCQYPRTQTVSLSSSDGSLPNPQYLTAPPIDSELFSEEDLTSVLGGPGVFAYW